MQLTSINKNRLGRQANQQASRRPKPPRKSRGSRSVWSRCRDVKLGFPSHHATCSLATFINFHQSPRSHGSLTALPLSAATAISLLATHPTLHMQLLPHMPHD